MRREAELDALAKEKLEPKRYAHVLRVVKTSEELAKRFGADIETVKTAAYLHDIAKNLPDGQLQDILLAGGESSYLSYNPGVWHAPAGAILARTEYDIADADILAAIKNHTTGRANMSLVEEIVFLADYIEPARKQPGVSEIRKLAEASLPQAICRTLGNTISYLEASGQDIHPDIYEAHQYYKELIGVD